MTEKQLDKVVVHPLVLLSVTDHFTRVGKTGRVVGILLGKWTMGGTELDISNSFALPFDEDNKDSDIWFLDHDYLESMFTVSIFSKCTGRNIFLDVQKSKRTRAYCWLVSHWSTIEG